MADAVLFIETKPTVYGGQKALLARCAELDRRAIRYAIIHPFHDSDFLQQARDVAIRGDVIHPTRRQIGATRASQSLYILTQLLYRTRRKQCRVIHADAFDSAYLIAGLRRLGLLLRQRLVFTIRSERYTRFNRLDRALLQRLDAICTNSDFSRLGIAAASGILTSNIAVTYTPIDFEQWSNATSSSHEVPNDRVVIGYMGSLETRKRLDRFLDFGHRFARTQPHRRISLRVYGTAKRPDQAIDTGDQTTRQSSAEVIFAGYATPDDALKKIDVLFCPFDDEPLGRVVAEFLYLGIPVVAMKAGGLPEAGCGHAWLVSGQTEEQRYRSFEAHLNDWLEGKKPRPEFIAVRRALEQRFAASNVVSRELAVYGWHTEDGRSR